MLNKQTFSQNMNLPVKNFDEKINSIKQQFFSALDDFKKYYVYYNKNPEVNEFQNYYANSKGQLQKMSRDLFLTTNDIDKQIEILEEAIQTMATLLKEERELNGKLTTKINNLRNTNSSSELLIDDSKTIYNTQYYSNFELIVGILLMIGIMVSIFRAKTAGTPTIGPGIFFGIAAVLFMACLAFLNFGAAALFVFGTTAVLTIGIYIMMK